METTIATKTKWQIDTAHSEITFKVKHLMISNVKGAFKKFDADIYTADDNFKNAEINVRINTDSVDTGDVQRDGHLKGSDFFDVENHPQMLFASTRFEKKDSDSFVLTGDLTIRDVTKQVQLDVEFGGIMKDPWGNNKAGFTVSGKINRKDWGLNWNAALEAGGVLVSDEVKIAGEIQLLKAPIE